MLYNLWYNSYIDLFERKYGVQTALSAITQVRADIMFIAIYKKTS